jgi:hypothetical protein
LQLDLRRSERQNSTLGYSNAEIGIIRLNWERHGRKSGDYQSGFSRAKPAVSYMTAEKSVSGVSVMPYRLWGMFGLSRHNQPGKYTILLVAILMLIIVQPLFVHHSLAQAFALVLTGFVLVSALATLNVSRTYFILGLSILFPALLGRCILQFQQNKPAEVITAVSASVFLMITVVGLIRHLFTVKVVTFDTISAGICAYLLLALAWAFIYGLIVVEAPGSFSPGLFINHAASGSSLVMTMNNAIYYSFVCLTTTGYGDIAPISELTRLLSILESVTGQMYLAILIARLVSLQVAQSITGKD